MYLQAFFRCCPTRLVPGIAGTWKRVPDLEYQDLVRRRSLSAVLYYRSLEPITERSSRDTHKPHNLTRFGGECLDPVAVGSASDWLPQSQYQKQVEN